MDNPSTPAPPPTAPAAPPVTPVVEPHSSQSPETAKMIEWEKDNLAKGKITPEEAAKRFDALGATPEQRVAPVDERDEEQKLVDDHFPPAAKPEDYQIRYSSPGQVAPPMTPELKQFDTTARTWLHGADFPRELGNSLITAIEKTAQATKAMTPAQLESYGYAEFAKLQRAYGNTLEEKLDAADRMVQVLDQKTPGLIHLLKSKGIYDNALVVAQIIGQAERYWIRRKGR